MESKIPIIFLHRGYSWFMEYTLRQAKYFNPDAPIHLLGDRSNKFRFIKHHLIDDYLDSTKEFVKNYQHLSTNSYEIELLCFIRWYIIRDFCIKNSIYNAFICDTDVLIFVNINKISQFYQDKDAYLIIPQYENPFMSYVNGAEAFVTIDFLNNFCHFLDRFYNNYANEIKEKMEYHKMANDNGGICDMTAFYYYTQKNRNRIGNILSVNKNATFDSNINLSDNEYPNEYKSGSNGKKVRIIDGLPYIFNNRLMKDVRFYLLHFQGSSKHLIKNYYSGSSLFISKNLLKNVIINLRMRLLSIYRRLKKFY